MTILQPLKDGRLASADKPWHGSAVIDGNLPPEAIDTILALPAFRETELSFTAASPAKAAHLRGALESRRHRIYCNLEEAGWMADSAFKSTTEAAGRLASMGAAMAVVTDGPRSVSCATARGARCQVIPPRGVVGSELGAGDRLVAGHILALSHGLGTERALERAVKAAADLPPTAPAWVR